MHGARHVGVLARQEILPALQHRHVNAEVGEQRGELQPHVAGAHDDRALGKYLHVQQRLARVHALAVRTGNVGQRGHGAGVDERARRLQLALAVGRAHGQVGGVHERGLAVDDLDARVVGERAVAPLAKAGRGLVLLVDHGLVALGTRRELAAFERTHGRRMHEHLRGEAGGVDAGPAVHAARALDHGDGEARARQVERQGLAGCSESYDRRIYLVHGSSFPRGPRGRVPRARAYGATG